MLCFLQNNWTALHAAATYGSNEVINFLIHNGAKVNAVAAVS